MKAASLCFFITITALAQEPSSSSEIFKCRRWREFSPAMRTGWVFGMVQGLVSGWTENKTVAGVEHLQSRYLIRGDASFSEIQSQISVICDDPANSAILIIDAFEITAMKFNGQTSAAIDGRLVELRRTAVLVAEKNFSSPPK